MSKRTPKFLLEARKGPLCRLEIAGFWKRHKTGGDHVQKPQSRVYVGEVCRLLSF
jgi:hypothetical protein